MTEHLSNGTTDSVVRIGDHVHRSRGYWSPSVEKLLIHLEDSKFPYSPRFRGLDENGHQILTFTSGVCGTYPAPDFIWSDRSLIQMGKMLRQFHDCTINFNFDGETWQSVCPIGLKPEVLCHNDFATYNCVYKNQTAIGMIDFDNCGPGSRAWDIAYTAFRCIPLVPPIQQAQFGVTAKVEFDKRLELLIEAYNLVRKAEVLELIPSRISSIREHTMEIALGSDRNAQRIRSEKHVESYDQALEFFNHQFGTK